ncbi:putative metallo-hydrolase [compost metagenome]
MLFKLSVGRTDLPGGDTNTLLDSIQDKLFLLDDEVIVYSGHVAKTTIGFERENNPYV